MEEDWLVVAVERNPQVCVEGARLAVGGMLFAAIAAERLAVVVESLRRAERNQRTGPCLQFQKGSNHHRHMVGNTWIEILQIPFYCKVYYIQCFKLIHQRYSGTYSSATHHEVADASEPNSISWSCVSFWGLWCQTRGSLVSAALMGTKY